MAEFLLSNLKVTLVLGLPLLVLYIYLLVVGMILGLRFRANLAKLVSGKVKGDAFKHTPLYGTHLILLLPYLYAVLAFSVFLVWDFALAGAFVLSEAPRIPLALIIALVVVVGASFWAILNGFFGSKERSSLGTPLTREAEPVLWSICDRVARDVGTRSLDRLILSPQPGIGVYLEGTLGTMLVGRTRRVLIVGMPSISGLTTRQFEAILAHEFGHFSNRDTAWNSLTFTMAASLENAISTMPSPTNSSGLWMTVLSALNPSLYVMYSYRVLFSVVTSGFSRMREVFADKTAIELYGYESFTEGLRRVARNDHLFSSQYVGEIIKVLHEEDKQFTNIFATMDEAGKNLPAETAAAVEKGILDSEKPSFFHSHPMLRDRLVYAKSFGTDSRGGGVTAGIRVLFNDWEDISKKMSDMFTYYIAHVTGYVFKGDDSEEEYGKTT